MKKLSLKEIEQHRLSVAEAKTARRYPIYVLLDNIRSLHNVGSIFRTADAARVEKVLLCGITGSPPRKEIDKTALGATETVPWEYYPDALNALRWLKSQSISIIALEHTAESSPHWEVQYPFPCCLVIGNEVWGIQEMVLEQTDMAIEIPMYGAKHSLNVGVAFGIAVYEMVKQFQSNKSG